MESGDVEPLGLWYARCMTRPASDILEEALALPPEARAEIASRLISSLDDGVDDDAEATWSAEIARRIRDIDNGTIRLVPWTEVRRRLTAQ